MKSLPVSPGPRYKADVTTTVSDFKFSVMCCTLSRGRRVRHMNQCCNGPIATRSSRGVLAYPWSVYATAPHRSLRIATLFEIGRRELSRTCLFSTYPAPCHLHDTSSHAYGHSSRSRYSVQVNTSAHHIQQHVPCRLNTAEIHFEDDCRPYGLISSGASWPLMICIKSVFPSHCPIIIMRLDT